MKSIFLSGWVLFFIVGIASRVEAQGLAGPTNLPIMVINTHGQEIPDEPKIPADMAIIYNGAGKMNRATDTVYDFNGKIGIELRGSSTQGFDKKPYAIEIQDGSGNSIDASLLGMPKKDDWVLDASYDDKTLLRNELAYKLGRSMGRYASRTRYIEMILNGYYIGLYALQEKVKRDKYRVNIAKLDPTSVSGDDLTGGYIIKIDKTTGSGGEGWYSPHQPVGNGAPVYFQFDYPKAEDLVPAQVSYIKAYVESFESSLAGNDFIDPSKGYANYMDFSSLVDFFIMMEVTKNPDGYRLSTYLSKQKDSQGGKLSMGPIWDFNEGFGNVNYCTQGNPEGFVWYFNSICPTDGYQIPFWWSRLFQDPSFKAAIAARWAALRSGPFQTSAVLDYVDSVSSVLSAGAMQRNFAVWPVLGTYVWPNYYVGESYADEITWIKDWIPKRLTWLDDHLADVISGIAEAPAFLLTAYPNPFVEDVSLEVDLPRPGTVEIDLFDMMGWKLDNRRLSYADAGRHSCAFHLPDTPAGLYFFKARMDERIQVVKILKSSR